MSKLLNLDVMSKLTERKIRLSVGVKTNKQLVKMAVENGVNVGKKPETQIKRALQYFGVIENEQIDSDYVAKIAAEKQIKKDIAEAKKYENALVKRIENNSPSAGSVVSDIYKVFKKNKGKSILFTFVVNNKLHHTFGFEYQNSTFDIPTTGFSSWWKQISRKFWINSDEDIFMSTYHDINKAYEYLHKPRNVTYEEMLALDHGVVYLYVAQEPLPVKKLVQYFRDGISHCMLSPIRDWLELKIDESKTKQTKSCYNTRLEKLCEFEKTYATGVPENALGEICNGLQIDVTVEMPFSDSTFIDVKSIKKALKHFKYQNTRMNHVEVVNGVQKLTEMNELTRSDDTIDVEFKDLLRWQAILDEKKIHYTFTKSNGNISSIKTIDKHFKTSNNFSQACSDFEIASGLADCKIDDVNDKALCEFIQEGSNYNETVDFKPWYNVVGCEIYGKVQKEGILHIDMKKAYTAFKQCKFYKGFLGKITDFRPTDKIEGVGLYRITKLCLKKCSDRFNQYNDKMKIYISNNVYTSCELEQLTDYGATFKIVSGCWGVRPLHFDFSDEMINTKTPQGVAYYAKWTGVCDSHSLENSMWLKCTYEFFNQVASNCGPNVAKKWHENGEARFSYKKAHNYHLAHITAFITAYQRMNVIEQLLTMEFDKIIRVCVDGIYFDGEMVPLCNVFRQKTDLNFKNIESGSYVSRAEVKTLLKTVSGIDNGDSYEYKDEREKNQVRAHFAKELHLGEGGCGKTHMNCNDNGLIRPLFVAPSWKLAISKKTENDINVTVWARALSDDPEKISAIRRRANVLIVDEVSMLSEDQKRQFFKLYPDMKIIMCGDLGYQLPCIVGEPMEASGFDNTVKHTNDFRCKDPALKGIKNVLREMIELDMPRQQINSYVISEFKRLGRCISSDQVKESYSVDDMILSGTNSIKDMYTKMLTGIDPVREKYYITENNRLHSNGEIIVSATKPELCKSEIRHCFTTHSIQGETAHFKLFVDSARMFDSRMFYTAISRAKKISQIFIIV
jgi:hypothetical protein